MNHITVFQRPRDEQSDSFLFSYFPGEVRDRIFTFTLSCYDNPNKLWDKDSSYVRPDYSAPVVADTALLRTCQRVYAENWFRPWVSATHTFYLAWEGRRPTGEQRTTVEKFQPFLDRLFAAHGEVEISHVRVFAQLCSLEPGKQITPILGMNSFFPRKLTVTIRHHDWWSWETDERLHIGSRWVLDCRFPDSLREVCVELESLERKKNQINWIAEEIMKTWHLQKRDGTVMSASRQDCKVSVWSGSSTWEGQRWVRDETKPGINDYFVKTIVWKPNKDMSSCPRPRDLCVPESFPQISGGQAYVHVSLLDQANIPAGLPADETLRRVQEWKEQQARQNREGHQEQNGHHDELTDNRDSTDQDEGSNDEEEGVSDESDEEGKSNDDDEKYKEVDVNVGFKEDEINFWNVEPDDGDGEEFANRQDGSSESADGSFQLQQTQHP